MPSTAGRYLAHLRQLWRLPNRVDTAARTTTADIVAQLETIRMQLSDLVGKRDLAGGLAAIHALVGSVDATVRAAREAQVGALDPTTGLPRQLALVDNAALGAQRARIRDRFGALDIETDHPVACESPDHQVPWGTRQDNSREQRFNARMMTLIPGDRLSLLDLGCSGGGLVRSMIEQGFLAAGIEGSDYSQKRLRAEWLTIPDFLFTADITKPFRIVSDAAGGPVRFGLVTLWEVIEHIAEPDLPALLRNIDAHLMPGGLVVLSVSPNSDIIDGVELHQTIQPRPWWEAFFATHGWRDHPGIIGWFGNDLVRWEANAPNSFHFALSRAHETPVVTRRTRHLLDSMPAPA